MRGFLFFVVVTSVNLKNCILSLIYEFFESNPGGKKLKAEFDLGVRVVGYSKVPKLSFWGKLRNTEDWGE